MHMYTIYEYKRSQEPPKKKKKNLLTFPQSLQLLEDQKKKLDVFCDQSYKNVSSYGCRPNLDPPIRGKEFCT